MGNRGKDNKDASYSPLAMCANIANVFYVNPTICSKISIFRLVTEK